MIRIKDFFEQTAPAFSSLLNYAAMVEEGIVLGKDGSFMKGWMFKGEDLDSVTDAQKAAVSRRLNQAFLALGSGYTIHTDCVRVKTYVYPPENKCFFPDEITKLIDDNRRLFFEKTGYMYESRHFIFLTWLPPISFKKHLFSVKNDKKKGDTSLLIERFKKKASLFEDSFRSVFEMEILGTDTTENGILYDRMLSHINYCIRSEEHRLKLPECPMYLDAILGGCFFEGGINPKIGDRYLGVVAIDGFPSESYPGILDTLDRLSVRYRWSTRFICMEPEQAKAKINASRRKWQQKIRGIRDQLFNTGKGVVNMDASNMTDDAEMALSDVSEAAVNYGYYTSVIIVLEKKQNRRDLKTKFIKNIINSFGFNARIETYNAIEAYLGSLPGNGIANISRPLLHTLNLADMLPISTQWAGLETNPCPLYPPSSAPLAITITDGDTPFRFNIHNNDIGHTLIFGPTGAGKSTLLSFMAAQFRRYENSTVFVFDKGKSMYALTKAVGGDFYDIGQEDTCFCPLRYIDTDLQKMKAEIWLQNLVELQGISLTPEFINEIHRSVELLETSKVRTLSDFKTNLQIEQLRSAFEAYVIGGSMGQLLDAEDDDLDMGSFQTFEMQSLLEMGNKVAIPVLFYIFNRIDEMLKGQPAIIILDEAWVLLGHEIFKEKIREWLKVKRKENCSIILATQSLSDAKRSGILDVLNESCPTRIYLANPTAIEEESAKLYKSLGCNSRMVEIISQIEPKKHYYYASPEGRRIFDLALDATALAFTGVSSKQDLASIDSLIEAYGNRWPEVWIDQRSGK